MTRKKAFDPAKPAQTRDGRPVRIFCTDWKGPPDSRTIAYSYTSNGIDFFSTCFSDGRQYRFGECDSDLVNIPQRKSTFRNVYPSTGVGAMYGSLDQASKAPGSSDRIGWLEFMYEDDVLVDGKFHKADSE